MTQINYEDYQRFHDEIVKCLALYREDPRPDSPALKQMNELIDQQSALGSES